MGRQEETLNWIASKVNTSFFVFFFSIALPPARGRKVLENRNVTDEERIGQLEKELEETIMLGEEADRKYEEVGSDALGRTSLLCLSSIAR